MVTTIVEQDTRAQAADVIDKHEAAREAAGAGPEGTPGKYDFDVEVTVPTAAEAAGSRSSGTFGPVRRRRSTSRRAGPTARRPQPVPSTTARPTRSSTAEAWPTATGGRVGRSSTASEAQTLGHSSLDGRSRRGPSPVPSA